MSLLDTLARLRGYARVIAPKSLPLFDLVIQGEPVAAAGLPVLRDAVNGGPAALAAFKQQAPDYYAHLQALALALKQVQAPAATQVSDAEVAAVAAHVAGVDPPGWAHADTVRWWDRAGGGADVP